MTFLEEGVMMSACRTKTITGGGVGGASHSLSVLITDRCRIRQTAAGCAETRGDLWNGT